MRINLGFAIVTIVISMRTSSLVAAMCMGGSALVCGLVACFG